MKKKKNVQKPGGHPAVLETPTLVEKRPYAILLLVVGLLLLIFYYQVLFAGKSFQNPDQLTSLAADPFVRNAPTTPLWCPYVFSGMPMFGSLMAARGVNLVIEILNDIFRSNRFWPIYIFYMVLGWFMFLLLKSQKAGTWPALFSSVAIVFIPQFVAFTAFGHNSKFLSVVMIPIILLTTIQLLEKKNLLYFSLTGFAVGFQMLLAHMQVVYYTFIMVAIYFLYKEIGEYRERKSLKAPLVSALWLIGAVAAGMMISAVLYTSVLDYQRYSIRGGGGEGGLDFDYAANWSFHPLEMITFFVPSFMGFGGDTYWGKMPFTDYPLYFGIVVFLLAGLAFILRRDRFSGYLGVIVLVSLLVSFGKHFPVLYTPMFKLLPFFNKFRIPSMIHILLDFGMVALAGYGLQAVVDFRNQNLRPADRESIEKKLKKYLYISLGVVAVIALFMLMAKSLYLDLAGSGNQPLNGSQRELAYQKAVIDGFKSLILAALAALLVMQYVRRKLSRTILGLSMIVLVVADLWFVDLKIVNPQPRTNEEAFFAPTPAVDYFKQDPSLYRIFPVLDDKGGNWYMRHYIQSISGYSAAKLRIYQEFLDETGFGSQDRYGLNGFISKYWRITMRDNRVAPVEVPLEQIAAGRRAFDSAVLDMLNVKYLVVNYLPIPDPRYRPVGDPTRLPVYENTTVLPRAFFVDSTAVLSGRKAIFDFMKSGRFDPHRTAIIEEAPPFAPAPAADNRADVTSYQMHEIKIDATVAAPAMMVLSEIYYPSGWKAFVDGKETKIYKTNYLLRSVFLQPGQHTVVFRFAPTSYSLGVWLTRITVLLLLALAGFSLWRSHVKKRLMARRNPVESAGGEAKGKA